MLARFVGVSSSIPLGLSYLFMLRQAVNCPCESFIVWRKSLKVKESEQEDVTVECIRWNRSGKHWMKHLLSQPNTTGWFDVTEECKDLFND